MSLHCCENSWRGSVTTHTRSGGEIKTIAEIFQQEECELYTEKLTKAALF